MRGERQALRAGELLVSLASRRLPPRIRQERRQEWLAELPVILRDRGPAPVRGRGPAPVRVVRMLAFAADTLRGTALAPQAYHGAHRGKATKNIRWLGTGLLLLGALLVLLPASALVLIYPEARDIHQLAAGPNLAYGVSWVLAGLIMLGATFIPRWYNPQRRWYSVSKLVAGVDLSLRAIASSSGWGHPLLFANISYCGYAISVACLGTAAVLTVRSIPQSAQAR
jgi:hypothetical protein